MTTTWKTITCEQREDFAATNALRPIASRTDPDGVYGTPGIYTEWCVGSDEQPRLRDWLPFENGRPSSPCEHKLAEQDGIADQARRIT